MKQTMKQELILARYVRLVHKYVPCPRVLKKKLIRDVKMNIRQYLQVHPDYGYAEVEAHFGKPQTIAASYIEDMDLQELVKAVHKRNRRLNVVLASASAVLVLWSAVCIYEFFDHVSHVNGFVESYIIDFSTEPPADLP